MFFLPLPKSKEELPFPALADARDRLERLGTKVGAPPSLLAELKAPAQLVELWLTVAGDDGAPVRRRAWRGRQSLDRPGLGSVRLQRDLDADGVRLQMLVAHLQAALYGVPFAGADGGLAVDGRGLSPALRARWAAAYAAGTAAVVDPEVDVLAPGAGAGAGFMAELDRARRRLGRPAGAVVGLPPALGGAAARASAVGRGGALVVDQFARQLGLNPAALRVAVHGFGPVGRAAAAWLAQGGYKVVALCERRGGVLASVALDPPALAAQLDAARRKDPEVTLARATGLPAASPEAVLGAEVDLLVLASAQGVVLPETVGQLKARRVVELARGAVTGAADEGLLAAGVAVLPDLLAGGAACVVDHLEWVAARRGMRFEEEEIDNRVAAAVQTAFRAMWSVAMDEGRSARDAALAVALRALAAQQG